MTRVKPGEGGWILTQHERAKQPWGPYLNHLLEVEEVWKCEFEVQSDIDTPKLEFKQPTEGRAIIKKMNEMLSLNADKRYIVTRFSNKDEEKKTCDRLERFCYAYENDLRETTGENIYALAGTLALLRGIAAIHTVYEQNAEHPMVRQKLYDPMEYFPVYGDNGIAWFTVEKWMTRWQLIEFFESMSPKDIEKLETEGMPDFKTAVDDKGHPYDADLEEELQVIQYWNWDWMGWSVGDQLISTWNHKWNRMTLREGRLEAAPFKDFRWRQEPFIGPITNALKLKAAATSKAVNAVEAQYWPRLLTKSDDGEIIVIPSTPTVNETTNIGPGGEVTVLNPHPNQDSLKVLIDLLSNDIAKMTLPDPAWTSSTGDESGFRASLTLNQIKGGVADTRRQLEMLFGLAMGDMLWMHEHYAPDGGWEYAMLEPDGKARIQTITADDIGKHQKVSVQITPSLPQDLLQMITTLLQMVTRDPITGERLFSVDAAKQAVGLADVIGDNSQDKEQIDWDMLLAKDPEMQQLDLQYKKARYEGKIRDMKKEIARVERREMRRDVARTAKDIEEGLTEDIVLPAEILGDAQKLQQFTMLVTQQGMMPQAALDAMQDGMPLGMPGEPVAAGQAMGGAQPGSFSPETMDVMSMLGIQQPPTPNGFEGYEGINPMAQPPEMMGSQPRRVLDQPQLQVENAEELLRRGAKPPAK